MLVNVAPQARTFWASIQVSYEEINPTLTDRWNKYRSEHGVPKVKRKGFRPADMTQEQAEKMDITNLYRDYWWQLLVNGVEKHMNTRVLYLSDLQATKYGNHYRVGAIVYFVPEVMHQSREKLLPDLEDLFIREDRVRDVHIDERIAELRASLQMSNEHIELYADEEPVKHDDTLMVLMTNEVEASASKVPQRHIVKLSESCPKDLYDLLIGKSIGDQVIAPLNVKVDGQQDQKFTQRINIQSKVKLKPVADEELLKAEGVDSFERLRDVIRQRLEDALENNCAKYIDRYCLSIRLEPVPGPYVYDRTEGFLNSLCRDQGQDTVLGNLGVRDVRAAMNTLLPQMQQSVHSELVCFVIAKLLDIPPDKEEIDKFLLDYQMGDSPEARLVAEFIVAKQKVLRYYHSRGKDRGGVKRIITPDEPRTGGGIILPGSFR